MISSVNLSEKSVSLLQVRSLNQEEIQDFSNLLAKAKTQQSSAKSILQSMSENDRALLQKANSLVDPINVSGLSEEGAANLLRQPDFSDRIDLNNDGVVEVGMGRSVVFPPVNAPANVKTAWDNTTQGMKEIDKAVLEMRMHVQVYGFQIEGIEQKQALPADQQWSQAGVDNLMKDLRSNLEFRVNLEGWTENNLMLKNFYHDFEAAIGSSSSFYTSSITSQKTPKNYSQDTADTQLASTEKNDVKAKLMQLLLDARMGVDRKKLDEINEKIKAVENDNSISKERKSEMVKALEYMKEVIFEEAEKRTVENEKRKALLSGNASTLENWQEDTLKSQSGYI